MEAVKVGPQMGIERVEAVKVGSQMGIEWVEAMKVGPQMGIERVEAVKVISRIVLSPNYGYGMLRILWLGPCGDGIS